MDVEVGVGVGGSEACREECGMKSSRTEYVAELSRAEPSQVVVTRVAQFSSRRQTAHCTVSATTVPHLLCQRGSTPLSVSPRKRVVAPPRRAPPSEQQQQQPASHHAAFARRPSSPCDAATCRPPCPSLPTHIRRTPCPATECLPCPAYLSLSVSTLLRNGVRLSVLSVFLPVQGGLSYLSLCPSLPLPLSLSLSVPLSCLPSGAKHTCKARKRSTLPTPPPPLERQGRATPRCRAPGDPPLRGRNRPPYPARSRFLLSPLPPLGDTRADRVGPA